MQPVFLGAVSAVSSFLQSVTGFGFGIVMMAVMPALFGISFGSGNIDDPFDDS